MTIDTPAKRHSSLNWGLPWRTQTLPDGTISQADRLVGLLLYAGIVALPPVNGPICFRQAMIFHPGGRAGQLNHPGAKQAAIYFPGGTVGDVFHPGAQEGDVFHPGGKAGLVT